MNHTNKQFVYRKMVLNFLHYNSGIRSMPALHLFNENRMSPSSLSLVRLDKFRSPPWSSTGDDFDDDGRIIINVPTQLLHLVTYENNSPPGCCTVKEKANDECC